MSLDESYILQRMEQIMKDSYCMWDIHDYIELRNLVCARLTMFNARRGGEPARMTLQEWLDADSEAWIDKDLVENISDPIEQDLLDTFKLACQSGKGSRKLVPVLIPSDTIKPLRKLAQERKPGRVFEENMFLFQNTGAWIDKDLVENISDPFEQDLLETFKLA